MKRVGINLLAIAAAFWPCGTHWGFRGFNKRYKTNVKISLMPI